MEDELKSWRQLVLEEHPFSVEQFFSKGINIAEISLATGSVLEGKTLDEIGFRKRFGVNVLAILREGKPRRSNLQGEVLQATDTLLVQGRFERLEALKDSQDFADFRASSKSKLTDVYRLDGRLLVTYFGGLGSSAGCAAIPLAIFSLSRPEVNLDRKGEPVLPV